MTNFTIGLLLGAAIAIILERFGLIDKIWGNLKNKID